MREWDENKCSNGDPKGLKGKVRLERFYGAWIRC